MAESNISKTTSSDLTNVQSDFSVNEAQSDAPTSTKYRWQNENFNQYLGYYKEIPELKSAINAISRWTIGRGFKASNFVTGLLMRVRGFNFDTFNTIIENMVRTYYIGGDAYAEIIRNKKGRLINLKPLNPAYMVNVASALGVIINFEQTGKNKVKIKTYKPEDIFYLPRNRVIDEIHGESMVKALEWTILAMNEAKRDMKTLMHRHVKPMRIWKLDEDDAVQIANFKNTVDEATENAENIYLPKDIVEMEVASIAPNQTLNPLPWLERLRNDFYQACGVPQIIVGGSSEFTEATAKIAYLAFQQTIEEEQLFLEEQILLQLGIKLKLQFPVSLENELLSDNKKDGNGFQANDTTAGRGQ